MNCNPSFNSDLNAGGCKFPDLQRTATRVIGFLAAALFATACASREKQVQQVAKDWCMTIRGSQVIPVYPLTEDIQPGDIFLVQVPVDRQQEVYKRKGFLPLDNHVARLNPSGYDGFYGQSFLTNSSERANILPRDWIRPNGVGLYFGTNGRSTYSWLAAPRAAFPSYSFSVRNGSGLNLALPVQGVPVGLSLLASDAASGSIQIQDARTLGVDTFSVYDQLRHWAATNASFLRHFGAGTLEKKTNFLRVVTRIYASGRMVVTLKDASNRSAGLDVGVPKPVNLLMPELSSGSSTDAETSLRNYTNSWNAISEMVKASSTARDAAGNLMPGGSLRLAAASSRSVSLDETFDPPVILGYLGFDCAIFKGGVLGPPIPTHAVLDPNFNLGHLLSMNPIYGQMLNLALYGVLSSDPGPKAQAIRDQLDALKAYVPNEFTTYTPEQPDPANYLLVSRRLTSDVLHSTNSPAYESFHGFKGKLDTSVAALQNALQLERFKLKSASGESIVTKGSPERASLEQALAYYRVLQAQADENPTIQRAFSDAHGYYLEQLLK